MAAMRTIRHSDRPRGKALRALYGIFRFVLYGIIGLAAEVSFYSLTRIGRSRIAEETRNWERISATMALFLAAK